MSETQVIARPEAGEQRGPQDSVYLLPPVDVVEDGQGITLYADLPGVPKDSLLLQVEGETLTIEGQIALALAEGATASHVEVNANRYRRVFTLSRELDSSQVEAAFEAGVLRLRIPKAAHAQPHKVQIQIA